MPERDFAERVQFHAANYAMKRFASLAPKLSSARAKHIDGAQLHPELQLMLLLRQALQTKSWHQQSPARARASLVAEARIAGGPSVPVGPVRNFTVRGPGGPLGFRHYAPKQAAGRPLVVFFHGGGFVLGDLDSHDQPCRKLCADAGVHVLSVDYRLAPEHPFPAATEDGFFAYCWALANAAALGANPARVAVAGDSAGANIAATVAVNARERGVAQPVLQVLLYPTADSLRSYPSLQQFARGYYLTLNDIAWCTAHYVGGAPVAHPLLSLVRTAKLHELAPAYVATCGFDPLRDEGEALANALRSAGNRVISRRFPDMLHAFINITGISSAAARAYAEVCSTVARLLDAPPDQGV